VPDRQYTEISTAEEREKEERDAIGAETRAMSAAFTDLQPLGEEARYRALLWLRRALDLPSKEPPF